MYYHYFFIFLNWLFNLEVWFPLGTPPTRLFCPFTFSLSFTDCCTLLTHYINIHVLTMKKFLINIIESVYVSTLPAVRAQIHLKRTSAFVPERSARSDWSVVVTWCHPSMLCPVSLSPLYDHQIKLFRRRRRKSLATKLLFCPFAPYVIFLLRMNVKPMSEQVDVVVHVTTQRQ